MTDSHSTDSQSGVYRHNDQMHQMHQMNSWMLKTKYIILSFSSALLSKAEWHMNYSSYKGGTNTDRVSVMDGGLCWLIDDTDMEKKKSNFISLHA